MAVNWSGIGNILAGTGAGLQGKLPAYLTAREAQLRTQMELDEQRRGAMAADFRKARNILQSGSPNALGTVQGLLQNRLDAIGQLGGDPSETAHLLRLAQEQKVPELAASLDWADDLMVRRGYLEAESAVLGDADAQKGPQDVYKDSKNRYYSVGTIFEPSTKTMSQVVTPQGHDHEFNPAEDGQLMLVNTQGLAPHEIPQHKGDVEEAMETAKLEVQFKLKPQVEAKVREAVAEVNTAFDRKEERYSNARVLETYDLAMGNLVTALGGATTGPGMGWVPAITENQQIAKGAIAAMAPILKSIFRASGEGTFTDADQKLLLGLIPTLDTLPKARTAQVAAIDALVRSKLGASAVSRELPMVNSRGWSLMTDAQGNKAYVGPNGEVEEAQ